MPKKNENDDSQANNNEQQSSNIFIRQLQESVAEQQAQKGHNEPSILATNEYNYQNRNGEDVDGSSPLVHKLRAKFAPARAWYRRFHYRMEDSSRTRRRWWFGGLTSIAAITFCLGMFWTKGLIVANTAVGHNKYFVNGDSVKITSERYDPHTQMIMAFLTTNSKSNTVDPQDLSASFRFAQAPKTNHVPTPTIQLLPLYQNHFVAVIRNAYPGFHGASIKLLDHSHLTPTQMQTAGQQYNGLPKGSSDYKDPHMGAYYLSNYQQKLIGLPTAQLSTKYVQAQNNLLNKVRNNNTQYLVLSQSLLEHNERSISRAQSGKGIMNYLLNQVVNHNKKDINLKYNLIKRDKKLMGQDKKKLKSLYKSSNLSNNDTQIQQTNTEMNSIKNEIGECNAAIGADNQALKQARDHWNQINNGTMQLPSPQNQNPEEQWGDGKD